jgi:hypothetical protein
MSEWGDATYGPEYEIACTWVAEASQSRDNSGAEFVGRHTIYTEDPRPGYLDMIQLAASGEWEQIRSKTSYDMSMFKDSTDFKLVTA